MADEIMLNPQQQIEEQLKKIREQTQSMISRVEKEGITTKTGETLVKPTIISADEVGDTTTLPSVPYNPPNEALASLSKIGADAGSLAAFYQQQLVESQKREEEAKKQLEGLKVPVAGEEAKLKETKAEFKIPEMSAEVQQQSLKVAQLKGDVDKIDIERNVELERVYAQQGVGMRFIQGQAGEVNRRYDIKKAFASAELGAQATLLQAQTGNLELANNMVQDVVNAYTFDIQAKRKDIQDLRTTYSDLIDDLNAEQKEALNDLTDRLEKEETATKAEKTQVMEWMISYPDSGITINDDLEDAAKKAQVSAKKKEEITTLTTFDDVLQDAINSGATPEAAARAAQAIAETQGLQLTPIQVERMKQRAALMTAVVPEIPPETITPPSIPKVAEAGAVIRTKVGEALEVPIQAVKTIGGVVSSFFSGLFGR